MNVLVLQIIFIGFGAFMGASIRFLATVYLPLPLVTVNVLGSFLAGLSHSYFCNSPQSLVLLLFNIGFLGSLTTFSSFSLEAINYLLSGQFFKAIFYILLSVFSSLLCCYIGYKIGTTL